MPRTSLILLPLLLLCGPVAAEIYRYTDSQGNTIFTDDPPKNVGAKPVTIKPTLTYPATRSPLPINKGSGKSENKADLYQQLSIINPEPEQTFRNPESITIKLNSQPGLASGHSYRLLINGLPYSQSQQPTFTIEQPDRGSLSLTAQIITAAGKSLFESTSRTIFVHKNTVPTPRNQRPGVNPPSN